MGKTKYSERPHITISVPRELIEKVKEIIKNDTVKGYRNHSEFVIDAIRRRIGELEPQELEKQELKKLLDEFKKFKMKEQSKKK